MKKFLLPIVAVMTLCVVQQASAATPRFKLFSSKKASAATPKLELLHTSNVFKYSSSDPFIQQQVALDKRIFGSDSAVQQTIDNLMQEFPEKIERTLITPIGW